jgi:hypothetical protein
MNTATLYSMALLGACLLTTSVAQAQCTIVSPDNMKAALVGKPGRLREAYELLVAGDLVNAIPVIACLPKVGSRVFVTDVGMTQHTIRVLDGSSRGCLGDIYTFNVLCK